MDIGGHLLTIYSPVQLIGLCSWIDLGILSSVNLLVVCTYASVQIPKDAYVIIIICTLHLYVPLDAQLFLSLIKWDFVWEARQSVMPGKPLICEWVYAYRVVFFYIAHIPGWARLVFGLSSKFHQPKASWLSINLSHLWSTSNKTVLNYNKKRLITLASFRAALILPAKCLEE